MSPTGPGVFLVVGVDHFCRISKTHIDTQQALKTWLAQTNVTVDVDLYPDSEQSYIHMWPRFVTIQGTNNDFPLAKLILCHWERTEKPDRNTISREKPPIWRLHYCNLLHSTLLANCLIKVVPHHSMTFKRGEIWYRELSDTTQEEILENSSAHGIIKVMKKKTK